MSQGAPEPGSPAEVVGRYSAEFQARMWLRPDQLDDRAALWECVARLDPVARDLLDALVLAAPLGHTVPERFGPEVDEDGEPLLLAGLLIPRTATGSGSSIDPRYYTAVCRVNPALRGHRVAPDLERRRDGHPSPPAFDARWDAFIVAAALEESPPRLARSGALRKDDLARLSRQLGGTDPDRWALALAVAQATGLARSAGGLLHGFPESKPRPLTHPVGLIEDEGEAAAAAVLLRVVGDDWLDLAALSDWLAEHAPQAIAARKRRRPRWSSREALWLRAAAELLHRVGALEGQRDADGVVALRRARSPQRPQPGFILTPNRELMLPPWGLPGPEYGRLARCAPYVDGDVLYRHRLVREGVAADLGCGHDDLESWLRERSQTGLPTVVAQAVRGWIQAASRVTLTSGVTLLEDPAAPEGARFTVLRGQVPAEARELSYRGLAPASFTMEGDCIRVPFGEDALTVRALVARIGTPLPPGTAAWQWRLGPQESADPERLLDELRRHHDGELPGGLETAVRAAGSTEAVAVRDEPARLLFLPLVVAEALRRDHVAGPLLLPAGPLERALVREADVGRLRERLAQLGVAWAD